MAASTLLDRAEKTEVFYSFGKMHNDQIAKFVRAPFTLVKINGSDCVMPNPMGGSTAELNTVISADPTTPEYYLGREDIGFYNGNRVVVEEHEMGDAQNDNYKSVHRFSYI